MKPKTTRCNNKRRLYANELDGEVAPSLSAKVQIRTQRFGEVCVQERPAIAGFKLGRPLVYTRHTPYMYPFSAVSSEDLPSPSAHRWSAPAAEGGRQHVVALVGRAFVCVVVYFSLSSSRLAVSFALPPALIVCGAS